MQPRDLLAYIIAIHEASYNGEDQFYVYIYIIIKGSLGWETSDIRTTSQ